MGEIADGLINGDFDSYTGEYLGPGPGFPRTADGSLPWERPRRQNKHRPRRQQTPDPKRRGPHPHDVTQVCTLLSEMGVKGKATRRKLLRDFCLRYPSIQDNGELQPYCTAIIQNQGENDLKIFIQLQNKTDA